MKKFSLLAALLTAWVLLTGCNNNCNCDVPKCEDSDIINEAKKICLENKWTYSWITEPDWEHWECMFPSWIWCRDDMILQWECNWKADTSDIDTEEERSEKCEESVSGWVEDMMEYDELKDIEYWEEQEVKDEEWNLSMITREFKVKYTKDWENWILDWVCEADFIRWGMWSTYHEEYMDK